MSYLNLDLFIKQILKEKEATLSNGGDMQSLLSQTNERLTKFNLNSTCHSFASALTDFCLKQTELLQEEDFFKPELSSLFLQSFLISNYKIPKATTVLIPTALVKKNTKVTNEERLTVLSQTFLKTLSPKENKDFFKKEDPIRGLNFIFDNFNKVKDKIDFTYVQKNTTKNFIETQSSFIVSVFAKFRQLELLNPYLDKETIQETVALLSDDIETLALFLIWQLFCGNIDEISNSRMALFLKINYCQNANKLIIERHQQTNSTFILFRILQELLFLNFGDYELIPKINLTLFDASCIRQTATVCKKSEIETFVRLNFQELKHSRGSNALSKNTDIEALVYLCSEFVKHSPVPESEKTLILSDLFWRNKNLDYLNNLETFNKKDFISIINYQIKSANALFTKTRNNIAKKYLPSITADALYHNLFLLSKLTSFFIEQFKSQKKLRFKTQYEKNNFLFSSREEFDRLTTQDLHTRQEDSDFLVELYNRIYKLWQFLGICPLDSDFYAEEEFLQKLAVFSKENFGETISNFYTLSELEFQNKYREEIKKALTDLQFNAIIELQDISRFEQSDKVKKEAVKLTSSKFEENLGFNLFYRLNYDLLNVGF